mmetsp:Transcript_58291/g.140521  ORF Transcript_58291/g.140521 Transcript_58291/m.140521 type:complete len:156 (-) Transcript_58291:577-1044(-)
MTKAPNAKWAQRKDKIFLTINIPNLDPAKTKINVTPTNFSFTSDEWSLVFDTFGEVNPDECKWTIGARDVTVLLVRKEEGEYWDKLQKGAKIQNMTVDWDKWKDEDEVADDDDFDSSGMQGMGGGMPGMGGMGGMGGMPGMGGIGGMGGMGGMGS